MTTGPWSLGLLCPLVTDPNPLPANTSSESPPPLAVSLAEKDVSVIAAAVAALSPEQRAALAEMLARTHGQEQADG